MERQFEGTIEGARGRIAALLNSELAMLRAGAVIVAASGRLDQRLFQAYVARAGLSGTHPPLESVGFVAPNGTESRGRTPAPCDASACREAMDAATSSGELRISAPLDGHRFAAFAPVYGANLDERRLLGFVYGIFLADELVAKAVPAAGAVLRLEDGDRVLHAGTNERDVPPRTATRNLALPGRTWRLRADAVAGFDRATRPRSDVVVGSLSAVLSAIVFALARLHVRSRAQAEEMRARLIVSDRLAALGALAAGVAHEINNPLCFVAANIEFAATSLGELPSGPHDDRLREVLASLAEASEGACRIAAIVRDLKTLGRNQEDQPASAVELRPVIEAALNIARCEVKHRAKVETDFADVPAVRGDPVRLGQVFLNLVVNAAQSMSDTHPQNTIRVVTRKGLDGNAVVEVADTGCGIPKALRDRIFEPFFTTKPAGQGTGLGLSICHGIITRLGGRIEVDSELGRGSTFRVVLPLA